MRANERDFYFAIQQRQFAAKMTNRVRLRLLRRITEMFHHRVGQIERCYQFCARLFSDVDRVTDVIRMTVRNQDEIDILERGDFSPSHFRKQDSRATDRPAELFRSGSQS